MSKTGLLALAILLLVFLVIYCKRKPKVSPRRAPDITPAPAWRLKELLDQATRLQEEQKFDEVETLYGEVLEIRRKQAETNPAHEPDVAMTLNKMANLYSDARQHEKAEAAYSEALEIYRRRAKAGPEWQPYVARTLSNFAAFCLLNRQNGRAGRMGDEAVNILRKCAKENPDGYGNDLAKTLLVLAYVFTEQTGRGEDIRVCAQEAERVAVDEDIKRKARKLIEKHKS
ncbi:MAG: hypothetical protein A3K09_01620 [Nitrospinae bacterium RIFCSPLOWO2_12_FULL_47_7]|nr:MAG: hypothetical protein A3K09_01620 [Nitrospinae bacterium RIFCSPLOWO2_12_FULL_47_7]